MKFIIDKKGQTYTAEFDPALAIEVIGEGKSIALAIGNLIMQVANAPSREGYIKIEYTDAFNRDLLELQRQLSRDVKEVFTTWKRVMEKPQAMLDPARKTRILWALKNYGKEKALLAIAGCGLSAWHMGINNDGTPKKKNNDITLIFKDATRIEQFIELATRPVKELKQETHYEQRQARANDYYGELYSSFPADNGGDGTVIDVVPENDFTLSQ